MKRVTDKNGEVLWPGDIVWFQRAYGPITSITPETHIIWVSLGLCRPIAFDPKQLEKQPSWSFRFHNT